MTEIVKINGVNLSDTSIDLSKGFSAFFRTWIVANNIKTLTDEDMQKAEQEYADFSEFSKRGWCGVERSIQRKKLTWPDE